MGNLCDNLWVNWFKSKPSPKSSILCIYGGCVILCYVDEDMHLHGCGGNVVLNRCDYWCYIRSILPSMVTSRGFRVGKVVEK